MLWKLVQLTNVLAISLSDRVQKVVDDVVCSEEVRVVLGVHSGSVLGPVMILLYTSDLSSILDNTLVGHADDSILLAEVSKPSNRVSSVSYLNHEFACIGDRYKRRSMLLKLIKKNSAVI